MPTKFNLWKKSFFLRSKTCLSNIIFYMKTLSRLLTDVPFWFTMIYSIKEKGILREKKKTKNVGCFKWEINGGANNEKIIGKYIKIITNKSYLYGWCIFCILVSYHVSLILCYTIYCRLSSYTLGNHGEDLVVSSFGCTNGKKKWHDIISKYAWK